MATSLATVSRLLNAVPGAKIVTVSRRCARNVVTRTTAATIAAAREEARRLQLIENQ
jgi:hypothetical protein